MIRILSSLLAHLYSLLHVLIGTSLSEPHIDGDVRPTSRGMFVSGRVVRLLSLCSREVTCAYTLTAPHDVILTWCDSKQDSALKTPGSTSTK